MAKNKNSEENKFSEETDNNGATAAAESTEVTAPESVTAESTDNADSAADESKQKSSSEGNDKKELAKLRQENESLQRKVEHQAMLITDLREELKATSLDAVSGIKTVKDTEGKRFQFIGKNHKVRLKKNGELQVVTAEKLAQNAELVDALVKLKVGFLV